MHPGKLLADDPKAKKSVHTMHIQKHIKNRIQLYISLSSDVNVNLRVSSISVAVCGRHKGNLYNCFLVITVV